MAMMHERNYIDELERLADLKNRGVLTDEEFLGKPRHGLPYTCLHLGLAEDWGWPTGISGTSAHMLSR